MNERIPQKDALRLQLAMIAGNEPAGGLLEVRYRMPTGRMGQCWHNCRRGWATVEMIQGLGCRTDCYVACAARRHRHGGASAIERVWCLWADCDGKESTAAALAHEPPPSMVVQSGSGPNVHAYWQLREPVDAQHAKRALRRIAHTLGADMAAAEPARILRPAGTLNHKGDPPAPVECVVLDAIPYAARDVVGHLPDPPVDRPPRRSRPTPIPVDDALHTIAPTDYIEGLTGREVGQDGKLQCPFHTGGQERTPSLHAYDDPGAGWHCFGCGRGGTIIDLGAALYGIEPRGRGYHEIRRRLAADLLRSAA